ncbi:unnamed protein product, partial [Vitis vinifera]
MRLVVRASALCLLKAVETGTRCMDSACGLIQHIGMNHNGMVCMNKVVHAPSCGRLKYLLFLSIHIGILNMMI